MVSAPLSSICHSCCQGSGFRRYTCTRTIITGVIGEILSAADVPPDTDLVVFCTGYTTRFPSYQASAFDNHRDRWLHMIDIGIGPSLAFIGYSRPAFGAVPLLSGMSARLWALLLLGLRSIATDDAREERDKHRSYEEHLFKCDASKVPTLVQNNGRWTRFLNGWLRATVRGMMANHPKVYERVIGSCFSGAHFRLCGDGTTEAAWQHVAGMPLPKFRRQHREALWEVKRLRLACKHFFFQLLGRMKNK